MAFSTGKMADAVLRTYLVRFFLRCSCSRAAMRFEIFTLSCSHEQPSLKTTTADNLRQFTYMRFTPCLDSGMQRE